MKRYEPFGIRISNRAPLPKIPVSIIVEYSVSAEPVILVPDAPETGSLSIRSEPSGADCWVDSRYYGQTPLTVSDLNPGSYDLLLRNAGYLDHEESARVNAGRTTSVYGGLTPTTPDTGTGTLQVD